MKAAAKISLFVPCLVDQFYPDIAKHVMAVLSSLGYSVEVPREQTCCGQPAFNAGYRTEASRLARHFIATFNRAECIVAPSGSCVSMVKNHYQKLDLARQDVEQWGKIRSTIHEFSDFLIKHHAESSMKGQFPFRVYYHASCHSLRELGIRNAGFKLLSRFEGIELIDATPALESCCGFGGIFSLHHPLLAEQLGIDKIRSVEFSPSTFLVVNDAGCLLHMTGVIKHLQSKIIPLHLASILALAMGLERNEYYGKPTLDRATLSAKE